MKTVDFSETIAASDLKVGRSSYLNEFMMMYEYERSRSFLDLAQDRVNTKIQTRFSQKLLCRSKPNFV